MPGIEIDPRRALLDTLMRRMGQRVIQRSPNTKALSLSLRCPERFLSVSPRMIRDLIEEAQHPGRGFAVLRLLVNNGDRAKNDAERLEVAEQILDIANSFLCKAAMLVWIELREKGSVELIYPYAQTYLQIINSGMNCVTGNITGLKNRSLISDYWQSLIPHWEFFGNIITIIGDTKSLIEDDTLDLALRIFSVGQRKIELDGNTSVTAAPVYHEYAGRLGRALVRNAAQSDWRTERRLDLRFEPVKKMDFTIEGEVLSRFSWPLTISDVALKSALRFLGWSMVLSTHKDASTVKIDFSRAR